METRLPFWHFFYEIETTLSYERWIDKYKLMLNAISSGQIPYDEDWRGFKHLMRALYLQDVRDEEIFSRLLDKAIEKEKSLLEQLLQPQAPIPDPNLSSSAEAQKKAASATQKEKKKLQMDEEFPDAPKTTQDERMAEPPDGREGTAKYYHPPVDMRQGGAATLPMNGDDHFLQTDEYFPISRRQMIMGWQYLRHKEKGKGIEGLDIVETTRQIARDGLFLEPQYRPGLQNRPDTLLVFADCRGSMTPFGELTDRLIQTARNEGGHPRAPVYYFQNYPQGFVYRHASLTKPVKLTEALLSANRQFTIAVIISDGGAARGHSDLERRTSRLRMSEGFLDILADRCARTIWLNPMPQHRWRRTAASLIAKRKSLLMVPLLDQDRYNFQDIMRTIFKNNPKTPT